MTDEQLPLVPVTRPDGRIYRPRKIVLRPVSDYDDLTTGVVVLGTHDIDLARRLADEFAERELGTGSAALDPETGWFREAFERNAPVWTRDEVRGRAGIMFRTLREGSG